MNNKTSSTSNSNSSQGCRGMDMGPQPYVLNIVAAAKQNCNYRTAIWTGTYLQATLMCIPVGGDIGTEVHPDTDQFLRIEQGCGIVKMGNGKDKVGLQQNISPGCAIFVPAGTWHNLINTGDVPLKLYTIYAPPHHPHGTIHRTKADAMAAENSSKK